MRSFVVIIEDPLDEGALEFFEGGVSFQSIELFFIDAMRPFYLAIDFALTGWNKLMVDVMFFA
jgi:hypothetical protein